MKYLITGGAGFIGSHLAEYLLAHDHSVSIIDDLSTGSIRNIAHLKANPKFEYVIDNVNNSNLMAELVDDCDAVFHMAAAVGVRLIVESPVRTIETNINGTEVVLRMAHKKKKPCLIASTSEVYGKSTQLPFNEEGDLVMGATNKGRWSYACSKAIDEFLALAYMKEKGLPTVVARLFNTVGPRQTGMYGMVIPSFVKQALNNKPITVYGTGDQTRCFCHVYDAVKALATLIERPDCYGQVFNIGSNYEISIHDLAKKVKTLSNSDSEIVKISYAEAYEEGFEDMLRRVPDIGKIKKHIGWEFERTLDDVINDVITYTKEKN
jgi:nucleoside-diphosphate-sugar epimerase